MESMLVDALECSVCLEQLSADNRVLPCQHTFCTACLIAVKEKQQNQFQCPECRLHIQQGIDKLPSNIILKRVLENLANVKLSAKKTAVVTPTKAGCSSTEKQPFAQTPLNTGKSSHSFLETPSGSQYSQSSPRIIQTLVPCTVEQVNRLMYGTGDQINGAVPYKITLLGIVRDITQGASCTYTEYDIDDNTGSPVTVKYFGSIMVDRNSYVRVFGRIQSYQQNPQFIASEIKIVVDMNEITNHLLEIVHNSLSYTKKKNMDRSIEEEWIYASDSSNDRKSKQTENSPLKKSVKRRILNDSNSDTDDFNHLLDYPQEELMVIAQRSPAKKSRRRISTFDNSSSSENPIDEPVTSSARKRAKTNQIYITSEDSKQENDASTSNSDTESLSDENIIRQALITPDKPIPKPGGSRSSTRIKKKADFCMPNRKDVFDAIPSTPTTEKSYSELLQRKIVNDYTKENSRYNYDPNYTSDDDSFIDDDYEYIDDDGLISEDSSHSPDVATKREKAGSKGKNIKRKKGGSIRKKTKRQTTSEESDSDSTTDESSHTSSESTHKKNRTKRIKSKTKKRNMKKKSKGQKTKTAKKSLKRRSRKKYSSSESTDSSDDKDMESETSSCNVRPKTSKTPSKCKGKSRKCSESKSDSSETSISSFSSNQSNDERQYIRKRRSKVKNKNANKHSSSSSELKSTSEEIDKVKKYKGKRIKRKKSHNSRKDSYKLESDDDSDMGDLSRSILNKVSQRSITTSRKKNEKLSAFDELKLTRASKSTNKS